MIRMTLSAEMTTHSLLLHRFKIPLLSSYLILASCISIYAQDFDKEKMDSLFALIDEYEQGMGSVSIFKNGEEVYSNSIGYANVKQKIKADRNTKYRIGSISKTFTATIVLQLIEEGKLSLSTPLSEFFPTVPNSDRITIEQLLRHRSGLYNFTNAADYRQWRVEPRTRNQLIELFVKNGTVFEPDAKFGYSNTNYLLLSYAVEDIEKATFAEVLQRRISEPLKLKNTNYGGRISSANNEAHSYRKMEQWQEENESDMSIPTGAGAIISTPYDLNTFFSALFDGKLISETLLDKMKTMVEGYGMGMMKFPFYDKWARGHGGGIDAFVSNSGYFETEDVVTTYLSNGVSMPFNDVLIGMLSIYFGKDYVLPDFKNQMVLTSEELDQYLGTYSSSSFPLKLTISKQGNQLFGQATGQNAFPLNPFEQDKFKFDVAGIQIDFKPLDSQLILKQGGGQFKLIREE